MHFKKIGDDGKGTSFYQIRNKNLKFQLFIKHINETLAMWTPRRKHSLYKIGEIR